MRTKVLSQDCSLIIVSMEEAMEHSRITDSYDEVVIQGCLDAAHDLVQKWLNRKLYPTTIVGQIENFNSKIILPYPPIQSVVSVTATDMNDEEVTLDEGVDWKYNSVTETIKFIGDLTSKRNYTDFTFNYTAGYDAGCPVPDAIKHAIKMTFATLYENREDTVIGASVNDVPLNARRVLSAYKVRSRT